MIVKIPLSIEFDKVNRNNFIISKEVFKAGIEKQPKELMNKGSYYIAKGTPSDEIKKSYEELFVINLNDSIWGRIKNIDIEKREAEVEIFDKEKEEYLKIKNPEIIFAYSSDYEIKDGIITVTNILAMKPYIMTKEKSVYKEN